MKTPVQILHLEDNPADALLIREMLKADGLECKITHVDTEAAFKAALERQPFDLVLCDFRLPGYDGMSALKHVRHLDSHLPVIVISGSLEPDEAVKTFKMGAVDYLLKHRLERLGQAVGRALQSSEETQLRLRADEDLRESERQFRDMLHYSAVGTAVVSLSGEILKVNPALCKICGYAEPELLAQPFSMLTHPDDRVKEQSQFLRLLNREKDVHIQERRFLGKDGTSGWVLFSAALTWRRNFQPRHFICQFQDVSARVELEGRVAQARKMEAIGLLAGGVAHDFNNQLTAILAYAELLKAGVQDPALRRYAENVVRAAQRSADLTRNLLAFARKGQFQNMPVEIHGVLAETIKLLERSIDKRIILQESYLANRGTVLGDASQLQNVFLNLALNARDAMPQGGTLKFETETVSFEESPKAEAGLNLPAGDYIKISVSDTGTGIAPEIKKHLFEPFFTTKPVGKGTGMGLASAYGTIKLHAGTINVYSEVGHGTVFRIYLPLSEQPAMAAKAETGKFKVNRTLRILIAEDEEMLRELYKDILDGSGFLTTLVNNGKEALDLYRQQWRTIDMVILDMVMPELNGPDAFIAMKQINPRIRALLASGYSLNKEVQVALDNGVLGLLQKPFSPSQLVSVIGKVFETVP